MLRVQVAIDDSGVLASMSADGHTGIAERGSDPVCAAASVLLLTAARTIETARGFDVEGGTERRGTLWLTVRTVASESREYGRGVTEMLVKGMGDLAQKYPDHVGLTITRETEETTDNGT